MIHSLETVGPDMWAGIHSYGAYAITGTRVERRRQAGERRQSLLARSRARKGGRQRLVR